jgi:hypothetical protein
MPTSLDVKFADYTLFGARTRVVTSGAVFSSVADRPNDAATTESSRHWTRYCAFAKPWTRAVSFAPVHVVPTGCCQGGA